MWFQKIRVCIIVSTDRINSRRDARVVEWVAFETRNTFTGIQGSNPCLSARKFLTSFVIFKCEVLRYGKRVSFECECVQSEKFFGGLVAHTDTRTFLPSFKSLALLLILISVMEFQNVFNFV